MTSSSPAPSRTVFVTGGTGYLGAQLIQQLTRRGHSVRALVRQASVSRLPSGAMPVVGDALHGLSYAAQVAPADTFVHLVGVSHPSPAKAEQFLTIDLASVAAAVPAAVTAGVKHFVYVSVAQPAPAMKAYVAARVRGEQLIRESGLSATFIRPWYVLGPGHWWPVMLLPGYWLAELVPSIRQTARRIGLVSRPQMVRALVHAVEQPVSGVRVIEVPDIRRATLT
ncbi:MAG TPA: NAD(P)H-binding protein [Gemmatimonadales bacterium]|nr:NAD(P)H-binding protein [Gemmatimonadales bacterium]